MVEILSIKSITAKYYKEIHEAALWAVDFGWHLEGTLNEAFDKEYAAYFGA